MLCGWLGLVLLSGSWLFLFPVTWPEPQWIAGGSLAGTGLLLIFCGGVLSDRRQSRLERSEWRRVLLFSLWLGLTIFGLQFLALQALRPLAARYHEAAFLSPVLKCFCQLAGISASTDGGVLFFQTEEEVVPFVTNWDKLGFVLPSTLCIALGVCVLVTKRGWVSRIKAVGLGLGALALYVLVRYLAICGWLLEFADLKGQTDTNPMWAFTGPWRTVLSFLPCAFLLSKIRFVLPSGNRWREQFFTPWRLAASSALAGLGIALALGAINLRLPGSPKPGRILVDDFHSGFWEPSALQLDTQGFGSKYLYSYSSLIEWLKYYYRVTVNESSELTDATLRDVDVLILKTPSKRFAPAEVAAIVAFVHRGGGLFLVGDHTNLLGMGSFLNEIASHFGLRFRYDGCNAFSTGYFSYFRPPVFFAHPLVQGIEPFKFMTSCTLACDWGVEPVMTAHDLASDPVDYSKPSFFGRLIPGPKSGFGLFTVAAAVRSGKGRVLALADSTPFSNFSMFQEAYPEFVVNACNYLNQTNTADSWVIWILAITGLGSLLFGLKLAAATGSATVCTVLCGGGLAGYLVAGVALREYHEQALPPPPAHAPCPQVAFMTGDHLQFGLPPAIGPSFIALEYSFDALFVVPQRFGAFPVLVSDSRLFADQFTARERTVASGRGGSKPSGNPFRSVVLVNPDDATTAAYQEPLRRYMESGGHLIVLKAKDLGDRFVQSLTTGALPAQRLSETRYEIPLSTNSPPPAVKQDSPSTNAVAALSLQTNAVPAKQILRPQYLRWSIGRGTLAVLTDSAYFSRAYLGHVMREPDETQLKLYQAMFDVFREAIGPLERPRLK